MIRILKNLASKFLKLFGVTVTNEGYLRRLEEDRRQLAVCRRASEDIDLLLELPEQHSSRLLNLLSDSKAQLRQDLFVLSELGFKEGGYFVEFGAANGMDLSNSYLLEKRFGWSGIVAEPATRWHEDLRKNRGCRIETNCVWTESGSVLTFNEADEGEYSTIDSFSFVGLAQSAQRARKVVQCQDHLSGGFVGQIQCTQGSSIIYRSTPKAANTRF